MYNQTNLYDRTQNSVPFNEVVSGEYGRRVIYTQEKEITRFNIVNELQKALVHHEFNRRAIAYLDGVYRGDQVISYRVKKIRPEINNKIVENHNYELVESKVADLFGEPVQYVLKNTSEDGKAIQLSKLNAYMESEDKSDIDIEKGRWASICGTSYLYVGNQNRNPAEFDETPFYLQVENPLNTFVAYFADDHTPAFSCQERRDSKGDFYHIFSNTEWFDIRGNEIVGYGVHNNLGIPVVEYPNNERRLSDIEITISITDAINKMQSDRMNGVEQFVQSFMKFKNCKIDDDTLDKMQSKGAIAIQDCQDGRTADVGMISSELNQNGTQTVKDDLYQNFLVIQGQAGRQENSGGDSGQAVVLRNGHWDEEKRAELRIPTFKKSERRMLRIVLNKLRVLEHFDLKISEIDIKPQRRKLENMMVKAQVLQILHQIGIDDAVAIKTVNLFSDVQEVVNASKERMDMQFSQNNNTVGGTVVENL